LHLLESAGKSRWMPPPGVRASPHLLLLPGSTSNK
jgi:hypothetical protein